VKVKFINDKSFIYESYNDENDEEKSLPIKPSTFIISITSGKKISLSNELFGLVRFLNDDPSQPHIVTLLIINVNGISKVSI
jgi:hypothetical protein